MRWGLGETGREPFYWPRPERREWLSAPTRPVEKFRKKNSIGVSWYSGGWHWWYSANSHNSATAAATSYETAHFRLDQNKRPSCPFVSPSCSVPKEKKLWKSHALILLTLYNICADIFIRTRKHLPCQRNKASKDTTVPWHENLWYSSVFLFWRVWFFSHTLIFHIIQKNYLLSCIFLLLVLLLEVVRACFVFLHVCIFFLNKT